MTEFQTTPLTPEQQAEAARLERQEPLKLNIPKVGIAVVGCGGVGSWIAYFLALAGVQNLWLFDPDVVSENNLNRLLLPPWAIGKPKSNALAEAILSFRPNAKLVPLASFTPELANILRLEREISWVMCSTDTWKSRKAIYQWAMDAEVRYIEASAEGEIGSISATPADFATPDEERPGYASVPVWVGPCVQAAAMACTAILRNMSFRSDDTYRFGYDRESRLMSLLTPKPPADEVGRTIIRINNEIENELEGLTPLPTIPQRRTA